MNRSQWRRLGIRIATVIGVLMLIAFCSRPDRATPPAAPVTRAPQPAVTYYAPAPTTPTPTYSAAPSPAKLPDVDIHHGDHVNMPDGALTGGYCRHKWWC